MTFYLTIAVETWIDLYCDVMNPRGLVFSNSGIRARNQLRKILDDFDFEVQRQKVFYSSYITQKHIDVKIASLAGCNKQSNKSI